MIFDLIAMQQEAAAVSTWTPADLFQNGEIGFWLDASDYTTMFQDNAGTIPVTAAGQVVGLWKNKVTGQTRNFNLLQSTASQKPLLDVVSGKSTVNFDGVNDQLESVTFSTISTTGATIAVGQTNHTSTTGYGLKIGNEVDLEVASGSKMRAAIFGGNATSSNLFTNNTPNVVVGYGRTSTVQTVVKLNGVATTGTMSGAGTSINSSTVQLPGTLTATPNVSQAVFINRVLTPAEITLLETFIASKQ